MMFLEMDPGSFSFMHGPNIKFTYNCVHISPVDWIVSVICFFLVSLEAQILTDLSY